jgi:hypothetical protein
MKYLLKYDIQILDTFDKNVAVKCWWSIKNDVKRSKYITW